MWKDLICNRLAIGKCKYTSYKISDITQASIVASSLSLEKLAICANREFIRKYLFIL